MFNLKDYIEQWWEVFVELKLLKCLVSKIDDGRRITLNGFVKSSFFLRKTIFPISSTFVLGGLTFESDGQFEAPFSCDTSDLE